MNQCCEPDCTMRTDHPYTAMLRDYESAADLLRAHIDTLNAKLRALSAKEQPPAGAERLLLEKRIQLLREEYY